MIRQVLVVRRRDFLKDPAGGKGNKGDEPPFPRIALWIRKLLGDYKGGLEVLDVPSKDWHVRLSTRPPTKLPSLEELVFSLGIPRDEVEQFRQAVKEANSRADQEGKPIPILWVGADPSLAATEFFCPSNIDQLLFGDRNAASLLTGAGVLRQRGLTGNGVNIVVIDQGFDASRVPRFGGGLANGAIEPGTTKAGHGLMIVRNICRCRARRNLLRRAAYSGENYQYPGLRKPRAACPVPTEVTYRIPACDIDSSVERTLAAGKRVVDIQPKRRGASRRLYGKSCTTRSMLRFKRSRVAQSTSSSPPATADSSVLTAVAGRRTLDLEPAFSAQILTGMF